MDKIQTPRIGDNGNWWVGNTDLNVRAQGNPGTNGQDGQTPHIQKYSLYLL